MYRKPVIAIGIFLLLAITAVSVYALITVDGTIDPAAEPEWNDSPPTTVCVNDVGGVNDDGVSRLDLTRACVYDGLYASGTVHVYWNWDTANFTNSNNEACVFIGIDTNADGTPDDGNADYALCASVDAATDNTFATGPTLYSCSAGTANSCGGAADIGFSGTCALNQNGNDPFVGGEAYPNDTTIECAIPVNDLGSTVDMDRTVLDVCTPGRDCLGLTNVPLTINLTSLYANSSSVFTWVLAVMVGALGLGSLAVVVRKQRD